MLHGHGSFAVILGSIRRDTYPGMKSGPDTPLFSRVWQPLKYLSFEELRWKEEGEELKDVIQLFKTRFRTASNTIWPEYKIELECRGLKAESSEFKDAGDSLSSIQGTDEHMNSILEGFNDDDKKKSLASFQKNMLKDPAQVLRCWLSDGKPLWPELCGRPCTTDIPKCNYCHGPLQFEFQIMPQLLYYMGVDQKDDPFEKSLDWATIAIYTCEASCDSVVIYKEEFPWVQLYESVSNLTE